MCVDVYEGPVHTKDDGFTPDEVAIGALKEGFPDPKVYDTIVGQIVADAHDMWEFGSWDTKEDALLAAVLDYMRPPSEGEQPKAPSSWLVFVEDGKGSIVQWRVFRAEWGNQRWPDVFAATS